MAAASHLDTTDRRGIEATPIRPDQRISEVDILRGFALSGILFTHVLNYNAEGNWPNLIDQVALWFTGLFIHDSFLNMFSFLFGLGIAIQSERTEGAGKPFAPLYARRLGVLLMIGLLHSLAILSDVLFKYAVLGFLLLPCRKLPRATFLAASCCCMVLIVATDKMLDGVVEFLFEWLRSVGLSGPPEWRQAWMDGTLWNVIVANAQVFVWKGFVFPIEYFMIAKTMFLGFYVGKLGVFQNLRERISTVRTVFWWSLALSVLGIGATIASITQLFADPHIPVFLGSIPGWPVLWMLIHPALFVCYMSSIVLLLQHERWARLLSPLGMYGRMALTNYLLQTLVLTMTVYGFALGMAGKISPSRGVLFVVVLVGVQICFSVFWLRHFRFGPVEWLWRSLTYWKPQPMALTRTN